MRGSIQGLLVIEGIRNRAAVIVIEGQVILVTGVVELGTVVVFSSLCTVTRVERVARHLVLVF